MSRSMEKRSSIVLIDQPWFCTKRCIGAIWLSRQMVHAYKSGEAVSTPTLPQTNLRVISVFRIEYY